MNAKVVEAVQKIIDASNHGIDNSIKSERVAEVIVSAFVALVQDRLNEIDGSEGWHPDHSGLESLLMHLRGLDWNPDSMMEDLNKLDLSS